MIGVHVRMVSKCKLQNDKTKYFEIIFIPCIVKSEITVVLVIKDITHFNEIEVLKVINILLFTKKKYIYFNVIIK